jgi:ribosome-associated protein
MIEIQPGLSLDENELDISFIRASGPGGQNVNKVSTAVQLRFDARRSPSLPNDVSIRLQANAGRKLTLEGVIVLTANRFRTQERNRADAIERLSEMIRTATQVQAPRRATKVSKAVKAKRLDAKARRAGLKSARARPNFD